MPEGDTILRAARTLNRALSGRTVTKFSSPLSQLKQAQLEGRVVTEVSAHGKNMLMNFDDGRTLYSHMRMHGSWHIYRPGEKWQKPAHLAVCSLETDAFVAVCFNAPVLELLTEKERTRHKVLGALGPDVLVEEFDSTEVLRRMRERGAMPVGEAIMLQQLLAGVGNVYKSETLFLCKLNPFKAVRDLDDKELLGMMQVARELMSKNLAPAQMRRTRAAWEGENYYVYRRQGEPCVMCTTPIEMRRQGLGGRSTYYCSRCQGVDGALFPSEK